MESRLSADVRSQPFDVIWLVKYYCVFRLILVYVGNVENRLFLLTGVNKVNMGQGD